MRKLKKFWRREKTETAKKIEVQQAYSSYVTVDDFYSPAVAEFFGNDIVTALVLNRMQHLSQFSSENNFHISQKQISNTLGLSLQQVRRAISVLKKYNFLTTERKDWKARLYYTVTEQAAALSRQCKNIIKFSPQLARLIGLKPAVVLSQLEFSQRVQSTQEWRKSKASISRETGLTLFSVTQAVKRLIQKNYVEVALKGDPRTSYWKIIDCQKERKMTEIDIYMQEILNDYNEVSKKGVLHLTERMIKDLLQRHREGRTLEDFQAVHRWKAQQWKNWSQKNIQFVPRVLWGDKFGIYLEEVSEMKNQTNTEKINTEELRNEAWKCYARNPGCTCRAEKNNTKHMCHYCARHNNDSKINGDGHQTTAPEKTHINPPPKNNNVSSSGAELDIVKADEIQNILSQFAEKIGKIKRRG